MKYKPLFALLLTLCIADFAIAQSYSFQKPFYGKYQRIQQDDKWGIAHYRNADSVFVEPTYAFIFPHALWDRYVIVNEGGELSPHASTVVINGKYGVITPMGKTVLPVTYDWIDRAVYAKGGQPMKGWGGTIFVLWTGGTWGIIGEEGKELSLEREYVFIHAVKVRADKKQHTPCSYFFYANEGGKEAHTDDGWYHFEGGTWRVLDAEGKEVCQFECDNFKAAPKGRAIIEKDGKRGYYEPESRKMVWE